MKKILLFLCTTIFLLQTAIANEDVRGVARKHATPFNNGTYRALIIGNNDYRDPKGTWTSLKTAKQDAMSISDILKSHYGFTDVTLLTNATNRDIVLAFQNLGRRTQSNDSVLVYYAGHGYLDEENNRGYWIPVDAVGNDISTFVRNSTIRDEIQSLAEKAYHTLLVSDSCFSGTLLRGGNRGSTLKEDGEYYYEKIAKKKSVQIFAAGGVEFVDDNYRNSGHSPFTYFLLNELKDNKRAYLTMNEFSTNVVKAVANNVKQTPEVGVLYGSGDELGEFIFARVSGAGNVTISVDNTPGESPVINVRTTPANSATAVPAFVDASSDEWAPIPRF